jgi:hypothetical protein
MGGPGKGRRGRTPEKFKKMYRRSGMRTIDVGWVFFGFSWVPRPLDAPVAVLLVNVSVAFAFLAVLG